MQKFLQKYLLEPLAFQGMKTSSANALAGWRVACEDVSFRRLLLFEVSLLTFLICCIYLQITTVPVIGTWIILLGLFLVPIVLEMHNVSIENTVDLATGRHVRTDDLKLNEVEISVKDYTRLGRDAKDLAGLPTLLSCIYLVFVVLFVLYTHWI